MSTVRKPPRNRELALIHQGKKQLRLDDETYRALLLRVTQKDSCAAMSQRERHAVIDEMKRLGFVSAQVAAFPGRPKRTDEVPLLRKIEALLADAKRPWNYAHAMGKRMFGADRLEFLRDEQLHKLVQALSVDARRRARRVRERQE